MSSRTGGQKHTPVAFCILSTGDYDSIRMSPPLALSKEVHESTTRPPTSPHTGGITNARYHTFRLVRYGPTDGPMDEPTNGQSESATINKLENKTKGEKSKKMNK